MVARARARRRRGAGDGRCRCGLARPVRAVRRFPAFGRTFTEAEDQANAKVAVLGHALWQRRFGGDAAVLGTTVLIDREPHEVIGVMPASFTTAFTPTELWTPLNATEATLLSGTTFVQTFARLRRRSDR